MNLVLEVFLLLTWTLWYFLEAVFLSLVPKSLRQKKNVAGELVLVTGAGSGIGRSMAIRFAKLGSTLILVDVNKQGNQETADMVREAGGSAYPYSCDLSSREQIYSTAEKVKRDVGEVTILINNAGIVTGKKFLDCPDALIEKTMAVNTHAHFWTVKAFLPTMIERNHGHVVNVASSAGIIGVTGLADYCASKFAAVGFDESIRFELQALRMSGVHTTVVCPFYINTGMFDGVQTRFPLILPVVQQEEAVDAIMDAVLTNTHLVYIPKILYLILALKGLLPVKVQFLLNSFFGINNAMDTFRGRK